MPVGEAATVAAGKYAVGRLISDDAPAARPGPAVVWCCSVGATGRLDLHERYGDADAEPERLS